MSENTEIIDPLAAEIVKAHNHAANLVENARAGIYESIDATVACAALVDTAKAEWGRTFTDRWREEVGLSGQESKRYLAIHHAAKRTIDKRQLFLIGILDQPDEEPQQHQRTPDPFAWCRWVPKIREVLSEDQIERMDSDQKEVARKTLKPLVELYERLS